MNGRKARARRELARGREPRTPSTPTAPSDGSRGSAGHALGPHAAAYTEWERRMKIRLLQAIQQSKTNQQEEQ